MIRKIRAAIFDLDGTLVDSLGLWEYCWTRFGEKYLGDPGFRPDPADDNYIALFRGPLTLAADSRSGKDADSVFDFEPAGSLCADAQIADGIPCQLKIKFTDRSGEDFYLVDYASAGRDWETVIAAWLRTK